MKKIELEANERAAVLKLPLTLRKKLETVVDWPGLGEDRRGKHWAAKSIDAGPRIYEVRSRFHKGPVMCTLGEAAKKVDLSPAELTQELAAALVKKFNKGSPSVSFPIDDDEITVTKTPEQKKRGSM